jgi:hypothetical protein
MIARIARLIEENRMADNTILIPAAELAAKNKARFPNESTEYRQARNVLLAKEIELRRHIERVAALRRAGVLHCVQDDGVESLCAEGLG